MRSVDAQLSIGDSDRWRGDDQTADHEPGWNDQRDEPGTGSQRNPDCHGNATRHSQDGDPRP